MISLPYLGDYNQPMQLLTVGDPGDFKEVGGGGGGATLGISRAENLILKIWPLPL